MRLFPRILLTLLAVLVLVGCKTTEANYRAAYETAAAHARESAGLDSTIYGRIRSRATNSVLAVGADSLPLRTERIVYTKDEGATRQSLHRYNIVVGQFKQIFNARQMRQRLISEGYDSAMIVNTAEPLYYVISRSVATPEEAKEAFERVKTDPKLVLRDPMPFILRPAHMK